MKRALAAGAAIGVVGAMVTAVPGQASPAQERVTICHATASATNPFVVITVSTSAVDGDGRNDHTGHAGDIIPPGWWLPAGQNWTANGIATLTNGCRPTAAADSDRDGTPDLQDTDDDGDGTVDAKDPDVDGDGTPNVRDRDFELEQDTDGDRTPDALDPDDDGDGIQDGVDPDSPERRDTDGDTVPDAQDPDVDGDCTVNAQDADIDGDGVVNAQEVDADADGVADVVEGEPTAPVEDETTVEPPAGELTARALARAAQCADAPIAAKPVAEADPTERDTDRDGLPDASDSDDDNDGVVDGRDGDADGDGSPETQAQTADIDTAVTLEDRDLAVEPVMTSAGQEVVTTVRCAPLLSGRALALGDVSPAAVSRSLCGVKRVSDGTTRVVARTSSPTQVTVVFAAPAAGDDRAFRVVERYVLNPA